jgi:hypothetical protein
LRAAAKADGRSTLTNLPSRGTPLIREWHGVKRHREVTPWRQDELTPLGFGVTEGLSR